MKKISLYVVIGILVFFKTSTSVAQNSSGGFYDTQILFVSQGFSINQNFNISIGAPSNEQLNNFKKETGGYYKLKYTFDTNPEIDFQGSSLNLLGVESVFKNSNLDKTTRSITVDYYPNDLVASNGSVDAFTIMNLKNLKSNPCNLPTQVNFSLELEGTPPSNSNSPFVPLTKNLSYAVNGNSQSGADVVFRELAIENNFPTGSIKDSRLPVRILVNTTNYFQSVNERVLTITYKNSIYHLLGVFEYNYSSSFNSQEPVSTGNYTHDAQTGVITFANNWVDNKSIVFYFSVVGSGVETTDFQATYNFKYQPCGASNNNEPKVIPKNLDVTNPITTDLIPSFDASPDNNHFICEQVNGYNANSLSSGSFLFEANYGYLSNGKKDIVINYGQGVSITGISNGSSNVIYQSFPNESKIIIPAGQLTGDFNTEFTINYTLPSQIATAKNLFKLSYSGINNFYIQKKYNVISACNRQVIVSDAYSPSLLKPKDLALLNIALSVANPSIYGRYTVDFSYRLDQDMSFTSGFSQTSLNSLLALSSNYSSTYKNVSIRYIKDINGVAYLTFKGYFDVGQGYQPLNINSLPVIVSQFATFTNTAKTSNVETVTSGSLTALGKSLSSWQLAGYNYSLDLSRFFVSCGGEVEISKIQRGSEITLVSYVKNNNNNQINFNPSTTIFTVDKPDFIASISAVKVLIEKSGINRGNDLIEPLTIDGFETFYFGAEQKLFSGKTMKIFITYKIKESFNNNSVDLKNIKIENVGSANGATIKKLGEQQIALELTNEDICIVQPCEACVSSFAPEANKEYIISGWVRVDYSNGENGFSPKSYNDVGLEISFPGTSNLLLFVPTEDNPIIDGWQRIEGIFKVPLAASSIQINLVNDGDLNAYFDDIRVHPLRSNMKSFVYDPATQRLTAELDENNYATLYEYDDEGNLIRVKKETERGVMTIQETRINQSKLTKP